MIHIPSQVLPRFVAAARSRRPARLHAARGRDSHAPAEHLQRLRRSSRATPSASRATRDLTTRGRPRICSPASRRACASGVSAPRCGYSTTRTCRPTSWPRCSTSSSWHAEDLYAGEGFTAFSDLLQLYAAVDLPRLKDRPPPPHPVAGVRARVRHLERHPRRGHPRAPPVPRLRRRHPLRARGRRRSRGPRHQDDALPREPGLAHRARAAHRGRERQGGRRPRRAAGALRRGGEYPLGPRARGGGRSRGLRPRRLQDPLQGVPRRPAGAPTASGATATSPPATTTRGRGASTATSGSSPAATRSARTSPSCSISSPATRARRLPPPPRSRPTDLRDGLVRAHPPRGRPCPGRAGRRGSSRR